jgi:hypothetical protein
MKTRYSLVASLVVLVAASASAAVLNTKQDAKADFKVAVETIQHVDSIAPQSIVLRRPL